MAYGDVTRTETAYYCPDCGHAHDHHNQTPGRRCSYEWCPCLKSVGEVKNDGEPRERTWRSSAFGREARA